MTVSTPDISYEEFMRDCPLLEGKIWKDHPETRELLMIVKYGPSWPKRELDELLRKRHLAKQGLPQETHTDRETANRERVKRNKRAWRERERAKRGLAPRERAETSHVDSDALSNARFKLDYERLMTWAKTPGKTQRALNHPDRLKSIFQSRVILQQCRAAESRDPTDGQFATMLQEKIGGPWTRKTAWRRLALLRRLEQEGGPWHVAEPETRI